MPAVRALTRYRWNNRELPGDGHDQSDVANADTPAPVIPHCGTSTHSSNAPPVVMTDPVTVMAATATSRCCTRRLASAKSTR